MDRDDISSRRVEELEARISLLERENDFLVTRSEDMLLLGLVAESLHAEEDGAGVLATGLERMSILRDIPYCLCGSLDGERLLVTGSYSSSADEGTPGSTIPIPGEVTRALGGATVLLSGEECAQKRLTLPLDGRSFVPDTVLLIPFSSRDVPAGLFVFADDSPGSRLTTMSETLQRLVELIASRLDNISLLEELKNANKELDRKVAARTSELTRANEGLRQEIEARTRVEQALRLSEERFRRVIESAQDALFVFDRSGALVDVNPRACRQLGYTREELTSLSFTDVAGLTAGEVSGAMAHVDAHGHLIKEGTHRRKDGSTFPVEISLAACDTTSERRYQAVARDISERRQLEEQLRQAQKMESVGRLAGGIAHDFNNLLSSIIGFSELTLLGLSPEDPLRENVLEIIDAGDRAAGLTRQLLVFSRKQVLEMKTVDLNTVIESSTRMLGRMIGEDVVLKLRLGPSLPPIKADVGQLEQVLMNLVVNARDAMPREGGEMVIETACLDLDDEYARSHQDLDPGRYVMFSVTDTGCGMASDVQQRIFDPFFTTKEEGKGTGLGLATVYGIVRQHKGHVWFSSEPGRGSTFKVHLPIVVEGESEGGAPSQVDIPRGSETVLIVDDDLSVRRLIARTVDSLGYRTFVAGSSEEALAFLEKEGEGIDLMLTDVIMPGMNGSRLAEIARSRNPAIKIVFMSGYPGEHIVGHELEEGTTYLQKPMALSILAVKLREALDANRS